MYESITSWFASHLETIQKLGAAWFLIGIGSLIITIVALPLVILKIPEDYFVRDRRLRLVKRTQHPLIAWTLLAAKNLLGLALFVLGSVMLFIPGQGILTMLIGLLLMNFPGKFKLERKLVQRPAVLNTLNRIRAKWDKPPLIDPASSH
ncbi:MAG: hypothetical protein KJO85_01390 [Gammaproteobacteria bacterium]|nr:hypothetical protein [Gammaproteobacteria bacterium]NND59141.1 hypothetical protein [Gammaproteobacteria bacterium]